METAGIAAARVTTPCVGFLSKIATGARAQRIDCATDVPANCSLEGNAAPRMIARPTHVRTSAENRVVFGQCVGHPSARFGIEFLT